MRLLSDFLSEGELKALINSGKIEQNSLVLFRRDKFQIFFAGTDEMHHNWFKKFRKCCILHNFNSKYQLLKKFASGSTSTIYKAVSREDENLAVKVFDKIKILSTTQNLSASILIIISFCFQLKMK